MPIIKLDKRDGDDRSARSMGGTRSRRSDPEVGSSEVPMSIASAPPVLGDLDLARGLHVGDRVSIFSRTEHRWVPGKVDSETHPERIAVVFETQGKLCRKTISRWSKDVRPPSAGSISTADENTTFENDHSQSSSGSSSVDRMTGSSNQIATRSPATSLYVHAPTKHTECTGLYHLYDFATDSPCKSDHPLWRLVGSDCVRWLYFGSDRAWHIGDTDEEKQCFQCTSGFFHGVPVSGEDHPDQVPRSTWYFFDRKGVPSSDPTMTVRSMETVEASIVQAMQTSDEQVLQVIEEAMAAGIPLAVLDSMFPMQIYVKECSTGVFLCGRYDLLLNHQTDRRLYWCHSGEQVEGSILTIFRDHPNDNSREDGNWMLGIWDERHENRGYMLFSGGAFLPSFGRYRTDIRLKASDHRCVKVNATVKEFNENRSPPATGIITSKIYARRNLLDAAKAQNWEWLQAALEIGKAAGLCKDELGSGKEALDKAFDTEKDATVTAMSLRSVSLRQMLDEYKRAHTRGLVDQDATTRDMVLQVAKLRTQERQISLAEHVNGSREKKVPMHHIVHSWDMKHMDVLKGLVFFITNYQTHSLDIDFIEDLLRKDGANPAVLDDQFFFCGYCVNQHISCDEVTDDFIGSDDPRCETNVFEQVAQRIHENGGNMIVTLDEAFKLLRRIWCLDEIHEALERGMRLDFTTSKIAELTEGDFVDVRECGARMQADKDRILSKINGSTGYEKFNNTVKDAIKSKVAHMRKKATEDPPQNHDGAFKRISDLEAEMQSLKEEHKSLASRVAFLEIPQA